MSDIDHIKNEITRWTQSGIWSDLTWFHYGSERKYGAKWESMEDEMALIKVNLGELRSR